MRTGRATVALLGNQPRYLQTTAVSTRRVGASTTTRPGNSQNQSTAISRRSSSINRVSAEVHQESDDVEGPKHGIAPEYLGELQANYGNEGYTTKFDPNGFRSREWRTNDGIGKETTNAHLKTELCERMEDIGRLTSQSAANRDEPREKDEQMRLLHNAVVDLKGQIRVAVRVRPPLGNSMCQRTIHLSYPGVSSIKLDQSKGSQSFEFQRVSGPNMSQARVFNDVEELILSCLHGYNVSIIAYGQTGSGKTHTIRGGEGESEGIIPRAVKFLFNSRDKLADLDWEFEFKASFIEVYNEEMGSGSTLISGLKYCDITAADDIENLLVIADRTRSTAATMCNEQSSRSYAVFELAIQGYNKTSGASRHA
nr:Kinesin domain containing protein [Haemonchus contortus]